MPNFYFHLVSKSHKMRQEIALGHTTSLRASLMPSATREQLLLLLFAAQRLNRAGWPTFPIYYLILSSQLFHFAGEKNQAASSPEQSDGSVTAHDTTTWQSNTQLPGQHPNRPSCFHSTNHVFFCPAPSVSHQFLTFVWVTKQNAEQD